MRSSHFSHSIRKALLFINPHKAAASAAALEIAAHLDTRGIESHAVSFESGAAGIDGSDGIAFSLGGDGTVLWTARTVSPFGIPIFPINLGTVGFMTAIPRDGWEPVFDAFLSLAPPQDAPPTTAPLSQEHSPQDAPLKISERLMLEARVERGGAIVGSGCALNDAVISASGIAKVIRLRVKAFDRGAEISLGVYRSDGLIAATPTGSTAYSAAAGGPIVDAEMEAIILNPICPFSLSNRPLVLPPDETILITIEPEQRSGVLLTLDGQKTIPLEAGDTLRIRKAPYHARLIAASRDTFYTALRTKLAWSDFFTSSS
jgi:NAD+ kinase